MWPGYLCQPFRSVFSWSAAGSDKTTKHTAMAVWLSHSYDCHSLSWSGHLHLGTGRHSGVLDVISLKRIREQLLLSLNPPPPNRPPPLVSVSAWLSVICWNRFSRWQDPGCLCASPVNSSSVSLTHWVTHSPNISPVYSCTWWLAHIFKWGIILT